MALPANTYQVGVIQVHNGQEMANVICVVSTGSNTEGNVAIDVANAWVDSLSFADAQVADIAYDRLEVRNLSTGGATVVVPWADTGASLSGNVVGDPVDPGSCLGFTLRTPIGGKSFRGRLYLGGVGRGALDGFSTSWDLGTSPGTTFAGAALQFQVTMLGSVTPLEWAVHSRKLEVATVITDITTRTSILSQNPRARRYGTV